jgi:hypothetical protein
VFCGLARLRTRSRVKKMVAEIRRVDSRAELQIVRARWLPHIARLPICIAVFPLALYLNVYLADSLLNATGVMKRIDDNHALMWIGGFAIVFVAYGLCRALYGRLGWQWRAWDGSSCLNCGYSLTGNTSGVCPECGQSILCKADQ